MPHLNRRRLLPGLALAACLPAIDAQAQNSNYCHWDRGPGPMRFVRDVGTLYVARDAALGSVIGYNLPSMLNTQPDFEARCRYGDAAGPTLQFDTTASKGIETTPVPPIAGEPTDGKILRTNIAGVGAFVRLGFPYANEPPAENLFYPIDRPTVPYTALRPGAFMLSPMRLYYLHNKITLVKTAPLAPGPHLLDGSELFSAQVTDIGRFFTYGITGTIIQAQCSISANPVSADPVQLGDWKATDFSGVGHTTPAVPFSITLSNCDRDPTGWPVTTAHIRLDGINGSQPIGPPTDGVFSLTSDSTAQGVAIQMLRDDGVRPMELGTELPMMPISPGDHQLHFTARLYQLDPRVKAGLAKGSLNFTMTYK